MTAAGSVVLSMGFTGPELLGIASLSLAVVSLGVIAWTLIVTRRFRPTDRARRLRDPDEYNSRLPR